MNKYKKEVAALLAALVLNICVPVMARNGPGNDASAPDGWCVFAPNSTRNSSGAITNGEVCVDYNGNLVPGYSSTSQDLGTATYPWDNVQTASINSNGLAVTIGGAITGSGALTSAGTLTASGPFVMSKAFYSVPKVGSTIPALTSVVYLTTSSAAGTIAMVGTPTISTTTTAIGLTGIPDGQFMVLASTLTGSYKFTLSDNAATAGSQLALYYGSSTVQVSSNSSVSFIFSSSDSLWHQISR